MSAQMPIKATSFRLDDVDLETLDGLERRLRVTRTDVVRIALRHLLRTLDLGDPVHLDQGADPQE